MTGYAIAHLTDVRIGPEVLEYITRIESTFEPFGGRWVVHGQAHDVLEGELLGDLVIIGFPSADLAHEWYASPAYREILPLRTAHSRATTVVVAGVPEGYRAQQTADKLT
ncbi:DUF1330 domain-containing protein [Actinosynnema mirum]|uniref:DUF1330 domain-containing protein n=1 Tax=Actinosynnema mirum (strain ATCC 29888 / DSM 43827 / JCM 3225 / NBRC 14064 / NCIMB 13271 / NRRL B-12336 / IMRU 3971 / 101) TaxID=446462 RepID=C6WMU9_ACTMD|nr:DUF1330 domain-containing protein [Actinosynnema mirum]ACU38462.1 protein of unknown function DUF1330 [Actinosynnema mirum DSM 43827]